MIPPRANEFERHRGRPLEFDREEYRRWSIIECGVGGRKKCRRIATRFEKLARNFLALIKTTIIGRYLRRLSDRA